MAKKWAIEIHRGGESYVVRWSWKNEGQLYETLDRWVESDELSFDDFDRLQISTGIEKAHERDFGRGG